MMGDTRRMRAYLLFLGDVLLLYGALFLTLFIRYRDTLTDAVIRAHVSAFTPIFAVFLILFYAARLYDAAGAPTITALLRQTLPALLIALALAIAYFYLFGAHLPGTIAPRTNLAIFFLFFTAGFSLWRRFSERLLGKTLARRAIAIGKKEEIAELAELLREHPEYGYRIVFAAAEDEWDIARIRKLVAEEGVTTIIASSHATGKLAPHIAELAMMNIDFWDAASFYEARIEKIPLGMLRETWFLENIVRREPKVFAMTKAMTDRLFALMILLVTLPLWPLIIFAIGLTSPGPVFYTQTRIGYREKPFRMYKFRTMYQDAEKAGAQWAEKNDPRVTPVGRVLRKLHLDELPQLWNIVRGDMAFVGPRPERPEFVAELAQHIPFYRLRHLVKPGLTGWAQLNFRYGASLEDAKKKLEYDLYYVKNRSLLLDLAILLKTLNVILRGETER